MLRLTIPNGTYQTILTLFGATESLIGCPITDFINFFTSNKVGREKKSYYLIWSILCFQESMNSMFYERLIHCYGKWHVFLTKINKINDTSWLSTRFIVDEVYLEEDINIVITSIDDKSFTKKKIKIENW